MVFSEVAMLLFSVIVLARSSSLVVDNAVKLSKYFNISQVAIGFILLAVATSLPELSVSVVSSSIGEGAISAGNVFGSNIANILLILGVGGFVFGLRISKADLKEIGFILLLTTIISAYIVFNSSVGQRALGFVEGVILLTIFAFYVWHTMQKKRFNDGNENGKISKKEALSAFVFFCFGVIIVMVSSGFVVSSAVSLARMLGIAESFIGSTIIAVGTSLPELSVDLQALRKKRYGIALGDAIGSNMTNITLVLGTAAAINPISVSIPVFIAALLFAVIANMLLLYAAAVNKGLQRLGGAIFITVYAVFLVTVFMLQVNELGAQ